MPPKQAMPHRVRPSAPMLKLRGAAGAVGVERCTWRAVAAWLILTTGWRKLICRLCGWTCWCDPLPHLPHLPTPTVLGAFLPSSKLSTSAFLSLASLPACLPCHLRTASATFTARTTFTPAPRGHRHRCARPPRGDGLAALRALRCCTASLVLWCLCTTRHSSPALLVARQTCGSDLPTCPSAHLPTCPPAHLPDRKSVV